MTEQETAAYAAGRKIAEDWMSLTPEFQQTEENAALLGEFLKAKHWELTHANLERAYRALKAQGHFAPAQAPLPPVPTKYEFLKTKKDLGKITDWRGLRHSAHWPEIKARIDEILRRGK